MNYLLLILFNQTDRLFQPTAQHSVPGIFWQCFPCKVQKFAILQSQKLVATIAGNNKTQMHDQTRSCTITVLFPFFLRLKKAYFRTMLQGFKSLACSNSALISKAFPDFPPTCRAIIEPNRCLTSAENKTNSLRTQSRPPDDHSSQQVNCQFCTER